MASLRSDPAQELQRYVLLLRCRKYWCTCTFYWEAFGRCSPGPSALSNPFESGAVS